MRKPARLYLMLVVLAALAASVALAGCGSSSGGQTSQTAAHGASSGSEPTFSSGPEPKSPTQEFTPPPQVKDQAPPGNCGTELSATDHSSAGCVFAENVRAAYYEEIATGPGAVDAYSPAAEGDSRMNCTAGKVHRCTDGTDTVTFP